MLKDIIMILSGLIGGYLLIKIRQKIINQTKEVAKEKFNLPKFTSGMLNITSSVGWAKDIASLFNVRKFVIYGLIISIIFGYGYFKGRKGAPVHFDMRGKEATIQLNEHYLKIEKDGTAKVVDKQGKILKTIKVKDIPELEKALRPYGFILEPIAIAGGSLSATGAKIEGGVGISWFKWYKTKLDSFLTTKAIYPLGISYSITERSGIGLGAGMDYKGERKTIIYYKFRF